MGNCLPFPKNSDPDVNIRSSTNSKEDSFQIESPVKDAEVNIADHDSMKLQSLSQEFSSKEEQFFDSHPWIDSDTEDFLSVNGDSSPVGGTSPLHGTSFVENPQSEELAAETSSTDMKKQLIELFRESFSNDVEESQDCKNTNDYESLDNSMSIKETTPRRSRLEPGQSTNCCIPSLMRSSSSSSERKKKLSPAYTS